MENNKEGILLSGRGRVEKQAELSENEKNFIDLIGLAEFLFDNDEKVRQKYKTFDNFKGILLKEVKSQNKNLDSSLDSILKRMLWIYKYKLDEIKHNKKAGELREIKSQMESFKKLQNLSPDMVSGVDELKKTLDEMGKLDLGGGDKEIN